VFHESFLESLRTANTTITSSSSGAVTATSTLLLPPLEELYPLPLPPNSTPSHSATYQECKGGLITHPCQTLFHSVCLSQKHPLPSSPQEHRSFGLYHPRQSTAMASSRHDPGRNRHVDRRIPSQTTCQQQQQQQRSDGIDSIDGRAPYLAPGTRN